MLSKIFFFIDVVVLAVDTSVLYYSDASCTTEASQGPTSTRDSCEAFLSEIQGFCSGSFSECDTIQIGICSSIQFWSQALGQTAAILECSTVPTISPTEHTCNDSITNGDETDVDCGGDECPACPSDCTGYVCGANYTLVDDPETVKCAAYPCTSSDLETCCERNALCSTYTGCFTGKVLIANSNSAYCQSPECGTEDRPQCCTDAGNCENFSLCDNRTQYLKNNPENLVCAKEVCDSSDIEKCCEDRADCSAYTCSFNDILTYRANYSDFYCAARECADTDSDVCCTNRTSCAPFICDPDFYLNKTDKESQFCTGFICEDNDWFNCCEKRQKCKSDFNPTYTYPCSVNELDENAYCAGIECVVPDDDVNCCPSNASCDSTACNLTVSVVNTTAKCTGNPCTDSDTQCCLARMSCVNTTVCSITEYVDENAYCAGVECDSSDNSECCLPKASCFNFNGCNSTTQYVNESAYCATQTCESTDASTCCINKATCSNYDCDLSTQSILSNYCDKNVCDSNDVSNCCEELSTPNPTTSLSRSPTAQTVSPTSPDSSTPSPTTLSSPTAATVSPISPDSSTPSPTTLSSPTAPTVSPTLKPTTLPTDIASCAGFQYCGEGQMLNGTAMCMTDSCTEVNDVSNCCIDLEEPSQISSGSSDDGLYIGIGVGVGVVLITVGVVAWYMHQRQKRVMGEKVSDVFEM